MKCTFPGCLMPDDACHGHAVVGDPWPPLGIPPSIAAQPPVLQPPDDSAARKTAPLVTGCLDYFPDALWEVAHLSWAGNEKHNPGEPLHDARRKSQDDADCLLRHLKDRGTWDEIITKDGRRIPVRHSAAVAWRALRILQREIEDDLPEGGVRKIARGARE